MASEDEDDYMNMVIEEPTKKETFSQRKLREQREAEARSRVPSKAERAAQEAARRDAALATSTLDPTNKGFQMMAKLGFKPGGVLGKRPTSDSDGANDSTLKARSEPLNVVVKENRGGIGLDSEKRRKIREEAEEAAKKIKHEEGSYRDRVREERELKRIEAQVRAAQKVAERLDAEAEEKEGATEPCPDNKGEDDPLDPDQPPAASKRRSLSGLHRNSTFFIADWSASLPGYDDPTMDRDDKKAISDEVDQNTSALEIELDEEDEELEAFNALEPAEQLHKLVLYLREKHRYCFWCKYAYETDLELEGCPGLTEEDHD
ncbi:hypothetical protein N7461_002132 [Penicillium sp. DV-2018c]|nr:hypothetical protein N7461_002132 [Penicillium sp. DV-2018c]